MDRAKVKTEEKIFTKQVPTHVELSLTLEEAILLAWLFGACNSHSATSVYSQLVDRLSESGVKLPIFSKHIKAIVDINKWVSIINPDYDKIAEIVKEATQ